MNTLLKLQEINLNTNNCVVIGSGILSAYGIRDSHDIDVVTTPDIYCSLAATSRFIKSDSYGQEVLTDDIFEIRTSWGVLGKDQTFDDLRAQSVIVNGVCYTSIEFLLAVKKSWIQSGNDRPKDLADVKLIEEFLNHQ